MNKILILLLIGTLAASAQPKSTNAPVKPSKPTGMKFKEKPVTGTATVSETTTVKTNSFEVSNQEGCPLCELMKNPQVASTFFHPPHNAPSFKKADQRATVEQVVRHTETVFEWSNKKTTNVSDEVLSATTNRFVLTPQWTKVPSL